MTDPTPTAQIPVHWITLFLMTLYIAVKEGLPLLRKNGNGNGSWRDKVKLEQIIAYDEALGAVRREEMRSVTKEVFGEVLKAEVVPILKQIAENTSH